MTTLDVDACRAQFPALKNGYLFGDNAGGSQCLESVAGALTDYLLNANAQLGATYSISAESTSRVQRGLEATATLFNAVSPTEITFGSSSTVLAENLARAVDGDVQSTDEIIVSDADHEANRGAWARLGKRRGLTVHRWTPVARAPNENPYSVQLRIEDLLKLVTAHTRLVAFTACSNILGEVTDVKAVVKALRARAQEVGARKIEVSVDAVAYAPHKRIDVQDWDADYVFFSFYKVYGAHFAALYTRSASREPLSSIAHYFLTTPSYKLAIGGPGYELVYSTTAVLKYLESLDPSGDGELAAAFSAISRHERTLMKPLLEFLLSDPAKERGIRIVGPETLESRVPTVSFVVVGDRPMKSADIVTEVDKAQNIGIRFGHFYAHNLLGHVLGLDPEDGVVRVSLVHYNTVEDVNRVIGILRGILLS